MARLLHVIRSLPGEEYRKLFSLVPHAGKKKQPRRDRIRVVIVELLRFLNQAFRDHGEIALLFPLPKRSALMALCSILMKEEEEILFSTGPDYDADPIGRGDTSSSPQTWYHQNLVLSRSKYGAIEQVCAMASIWDEEKFAKKLDEESYEEADKEEGVKEGEYVFQMEACQCYRCLYDVQILPGCEDRKTGTTFASLQDEAYVSPRGLLQEEIALPFLFDTNDRTTESPYKVCLGHLWYVMGANYILGRAKRRGNLVELMELEQHVRERVEFLMKDVMYYHPDRVDSWVRLGNTIKELYHADAFATALGRKLKARAFQW
ncbi:unnamed protein product [Peronospora destructor]|uniref:Uncharacterized protein n=1 Tax=Peronospora destructor TaxID=86335 RepID=A0AAV0V694_9STRA|nr:unnamed protein product [Peronospora destructor]